MATTFPTTIDNFINPSTTDILGPTHSVQHTNNNDAIEAIEAKIGINASGVTTTHDYKLNEVISTDKAVGKTATQTLTNKTLTNPVITGGVINAGADLTASSTELNYNDITTPGTAQATKTLVTDSNIDINLGTGDITATIGTFTNSIRFNSIAGFLINGRISVTVASNNLTVALKTLANTDASASNPIYIRVGEVIVSITAALSVTRNAGTNWLGAGSAEMATYEIDYFTYIGFNATDGVTLGFARVPCFRRYSDINTTNTDQLHMAISNITNASAEDAYENIGRFAATLSAGAGFTWSVPTFNRVNLVNSPINESRFLTYKPTWSGNGSMTFTSVTPTTNRYQVISNNCIAGFNGIGTVGGTLNNTLIATSPFKSLDADSNPIVGGYNSQTFSGVMQMAFNTINASFYRSTGANYTAGAGTQVSGGLNIRIF